MENIIAEVMEYYEKSEDVYWELYDSHRGTTTIYELDQLDKIIDTGCVQPQRYDEVIINGVQHQCTVDLYNTDKLMKLVLFAPDFHEFICIHKPGGSYETRFSIKQVNPRDYFKKTAGSRILTEGSNKKWI